MVAKKKPNGGNGELVVKDKLGDMD